MKKTFLLGITIVLCSAGMPQEQFITRFEKSGETETATYEEGINFYQALADAFPEINIEAKGMTDSGKPLHLVMLSLDGDFDATSIRKKNKTILLINNAIHPGEPDGVDASMMLLRDLAQKQTEYKQYLEKVVIAVIPFYNIGGALNRNSTSRANQNGPKEYGFRGNGRNYDLNRDFIKADTKNARSFASIFHELDPDVLLDTHVTNGADYPYVMTMVVPQKDKLGGALANYTENVMEPSLYKQMAASGTEMIPYVDVYGKPPDDGFPQFLDLPRYSSGYTALFQTIGFISEAHMLKPYGRRVHATYTFLENVLKVVSRDGERIRQLKEQDRKAVGVQKRFAVSWKLDESRHTNLDFKGYEARYVNSKVTGKKRLLYDRNKPWRKQIPYYNHYIPDVMVDKPDNYVIPQAWYTIVELLRLNKVQLRQIQRDSTFEVEAYYIADYQTGEQPYEGHYPHYAVKLRKEKQQRTFRRGDYLVAVNQPANRYIMETLEPQATDSFFSWNFFDTILQQKEWFSSYVFEDTAEQILKDNDSLRTVFEQKKLQEPKFAEDSRAQLDFIFRNSPHYEEAHLLYPVFRTWN